MLSRICFIAWVECMIGCGVIWADPATPETTAHFMFREPRLAGYRVAHVTPAPGVLKAAAAQWMEGWPDNGSTNMVQFGNRVVLRTKPAVDLKTVLTGRSLQLAREVAPSLFILQAPDAWTALREASSLATDPRVIAAYPVTRRAKQLLNLYAPKPNDPLFSQPDQSNDQWQANLENRDTNGTPMGIDLNVRAAWPISQGDGVLVGVADTGIELDHPDLVDRTGGAPHYNFGTMQPDGSPPDGGSIHGTPVAGLIGATANNHIGIAGVAPKVRLASWVIFGPNEASISEEGLMDMFQYQSNVVSVQNHSWASSDGNVQSPLSALEDQAISNAVYFGRSGRGVVMVRAAGNGRTETIDANDDGYMADPRVIVVAAARLDGRVAGYSSPGANILVAAPGGDNDPSYHPCLPNSAAMVSTDRQGPAGLNPSPSPDGDYALGARGFAGTSAATPQISGIAALILAANTNLTYRDVQQILILSSRFTDLSDPTLATNAAGFRVSHNLGFGVPDAGEAVRLARLWSNRPPAKTITLEATNSAAVPDLGLQLLTFGSDVPTNLASIAASPGGGPQWDTNSLLMPLVDVGAATAPLTNDLSGKAALIQRGSNNFCQKIQYAADAGAALAIVYNNRDATVRILMGATDLTPIPSIFLNQDDGEALRDFAAATPDVRVQLSLNATNYTFNVAETLQCEFVGVRVTTDHTARGDLRIVLTSPGGTRSVLQRVNFDTQPGPTDWTYYSVQNFYESSYGTWTLSMSDQDINGTGSVLGASLIITGVPITDTDHDGLDDNWERRHFQALAYGPADDPNHDGFTNAREQLMGTDPTASPAPLAMQVAQWDGRLARLSWASTTNTGYQVFSSGDVTAPLMTLTNLPGQFPQTEWFVPYTGAPQQFFRIKAVPR